MNNKNTNLNYVLIFVITTVIGIFLHINRYVFKFIPYDNIRVLFDHFITGFLAPLWIYMIFLGLTSFYEPNRKIYYNLNWFLFATIIYLFCMLIIWEFIIQRFKDPSQIIAEVIGLLLSWVYFFRFRRTKIQIKIKGAK